MSPASPWNPNLVRALRRLRRRLWTPLPKLHPDLGSRPDINGRAGRDEVR